MVFSDIDTDVGIINTEKYWIPTKKYRKYQTVGIFDLSYLYFRPQLPYFDDNYFDFYFSAEVIV